MSTPKTYRDDRGIERYMDGERVDGQSPRDDESSKPAQPRKESAMSEPQYRMVEIGEVIEKTDEVRPTLDSDHWNKVKVSQGEKLSHPHYGCFRRPLPPPASRTEDETISELTHCPRCGKAWTDHSYLCEVELAPSAAQPCPVCGKPGVPEGRPCHQHCLPLLQEPSPAQPTAEREIHIFEYHDCADGQPLTCKYCGELEGHSNHGPVAATFENLPAPSPAQPTAEALICCVCGEPAQQLPCCKSCFAKWEAGEELPKLAPARSTAEACGKCGEALKYCFSGEDRVSQCPKCLGKWRPAPEPTQPDAARGTDTPTPRTDTLLAREAASARHARDFAAGSAHVAMDALAEAQSTIAQLKNENATLRQYWQDRDKVATRQIEAYHATIRYCNSVLIPHFDCGAAPLEELVRRAVKYGQAKDAEVAQMRETIERLTVERDNLSSTLETVLRRELLASGYHKRTAREVEIEQALDQTPIADRDPADITIAELLELVDAGRNRVVLAESQRDAALADAERLRGVLRQIVRLPKFWNAPKVGIEAPAIAQAALQSKAEGGE